MSSNENNKTTKEIDKNLIEFWFLRRVVTLVSTLKGKQINISARLLDT